MAILLIAEHDNATLSDQTAKTLSAALKINLRLQKRATLISGALANHPRAVGND